MPFAGCPRRATASRCATRNGPRCARCSYSNAWRRLTAGLCGAWWGRRPGRPRGGRREGAVLKGAAVAANGVEAAAVAAGKTEVATTLGARMKGFASRVLRLVLSRGKAAEEVGATAHGAALALEDASVIESFEGGRYSLRITTEPETVYRAEGGSSKTFGRFFGTVKPETGAHAEQLSNLASWGNELTEVSTYVIPPGTTIYEGRVADGTGWQYFLGGVAVSFTRFAKGLEELASFLEHCGESSWPPILRRLKSEVTNADPTNKTALAELVTRLRPLFGGMGSLNDLYLCRENGHNVPNEQVANAKLRAQVATLYTAFVEIRNRR